MSGDSGNIKNPGWYTGGLAGAMAPGAGNVYYVNGGSDGPVVDTNDGLTPATPKQLLQSAIDLCVSNNNDYVIVLNYGGNARAVESWPVLLNKDQVHIIGVGDVAQKWPVVSVAAPAAGDTAAAAIRVTGNRVEIAGLELGGGDTAGCLELRTQWGANIHDCFFGVTGDGVGRDGIHVPATFDAAYLTVWGCRFGASITRDGIRIDTQATRGMLGVSGYPSNFFDLVPGIGINIVGPVNLAGIFDNRFALNDDGTGEAITIAAGASGGFVDGNVAGSANADPGNEPYVDTGNASFSGLNYKGITATNLT